MSSNGATNNGDLGQQIAYLASGCFWCTEAVFQDLRGVSEAQSGYMGGHTASPTYDQICTGRTGHAEMVRVTFDPRQLSFRNLLEVFFAVHDPTTLNRQGNDVGTQYRSAIFFENDEQHRIAEKVKARVEASGKWKRPITTEIVPATEFWPAEVYHQNYLQKHPGGYTCHYLRD